MITSAHNLKIQSVRALLSRRSEREQAEAFVVEGVRLAEEALASGWPAQLVLYTSRLSERGLRLLEGFSALGAQIEEVAPDLLDSITGTEAPQGILAVLSLRPLPIPPLPNFVLILDNLRDPGNLGTLLRSAAAAGIQAALLTPGTADAFAPKVVRSAMGAHFRLPIQSFSWEQIDLYLRPPAHPPLRLLIAEGEGGTPCWHVDLRAPLALVVGGEAEGVSPQARQRADQMVAIPMPGGSESLNAAIAGSILIFEIVRQRAI